MHMYLVYFPFVFAAKQYLDEGFDTETVIVLSRDLGWRPDVQSVKLKQSAIAIPFSPFEDNFYKHCFCCG